MNEENPYEPPILNDYEESGVKRDMAIHDLLIFFILSFGLGFFSGGTVVLFLL